MQLVGAQLRRALREEVARLDDAGRLAVALCVADIAAVNTAVAETQWTRNKAALALYHRTGGACARRTAALIANTRIETGESRSDVPVGAQRAALDEPAKRRLARCSDDALRAIADGADDLRARMRQVGNAAWLNGQPRHAVELRTTASYAFHVARWARAVLGSRPGTRTAGRDSFGTRDGRTGPRMNGRRMGANG